MMQTLLYSIAGMNGSKADRPFWCTNTGSSDQYYSACSDLYLQMQNDGNLVLYKSTRWAGTITIWASQSNGKPGNQFTLTMQDDGNVVIYGTNANWDTKTYGKI